MTNVQILRGNFNITDPDWPTYTIRKIITSDDFSGTGELVGSMTSATLGGVPMQWGGKVGAWTRQDGGITTPTGSYYDELTLADMPADVSVSTVIRDMGGSTSSGDQFIISVRASADRKDRTRASFYANGSVRLDQYTADGGRVMGDLVGGAFKLGDRVGIEANGKKAAATVNGHKIVEWDTEVLAPGDIVFTTYPLVDFILDDVIVAEA